MKILLVSMPSLHFFRWTEQLRNSGHDVYWFDVVDGESTQRLPWVKKINGWKHKYKHLRGRYFIKQKLPFLNKILSPFIERNLETEFEKVLQEIKPDLVHSFAVQISCVPIISVMEKYKTQKWIYSSWGSDLYDLKSVALTKTQVESVVKRIDYFISDCLRDFKIIKSYDFKGVYLGCFPGGGGYDIESLDKYIKTPVLGRKIILVKGYQGNLGKCIEVLYAIKNIEKKLEQYKIVVFSADKEVVDFIENLRLNSSLNFSILKKESFVPHEKILELMGQSIIYIGNSISDGMPNTLL